MVPTDVAVDEVDVLADMQSLLQSAPWIGPVSMARIDDTEKNTNNEVSFKELKSLK